jgi:hypothetical protein
MENKETRNNEVNKITETLTKEIESLSAEGLHEFFRFFYHLNHQHYNMITPDKFEEFLRPSRTTRLELMRTKNSEGS